MTSYVHIGVVRATGINHLESSASNQRAQESIRLYDNAPVATQKMYAGKSDISHYEKCFHCGGDYRNFRDAKEGDCLDGVTIQPILIGD